MYEAFDQQALELLVDGDMEFLRDIIAIFVKDSPPLLEKIGRSVREGNAETLADSAHALKGMMGNFSAGPAVAAAHEIEVMGREQRLANIDAAVERLQRETARLKSQLHDFLQAMQN